MNKYAPLSIRLEAQADHARIRELNRLAFGGEYEAGLIERIRAEELVATSLVALLDGSIVGHILFSDLSVAMDGWAVKSAALAPMAVLPGRQGTGIGSMLVRAGLDIVAAQGYEAVFVLGHPTYYPRFGFSAELAGKLASPYAGPAFMALELTPDALQGTSGTVTYSDTFDPD